MLEYDLSPPLLWRPEPWSWALPLTVPFSGSHFLASVSSSVKRGGISELIRGASYHDSGLSQCSVEGAFSLPQETFGTMPVHGKCPVALLWPLPLASLAFNIGR